ncbi:MAG: PQQ-like beta-propeller repeat protein [Planctomycetaceae bacterium]|nr:PQQ-like beta-propeller repeat protein [Planctomycetaceae bacterium]
MKFFVSLTAVLCLLIAQSSPSMLLAEDWPQWRGSRMNGTWNGPELQSTFTEKDMPEQWQHKCGGGYAGVTVADEKVFLHDRLEQGEANLKFSNQEVERVQCFELKTGERLWAHQYPVQYNDLDYGNGPRAAPTVVGDLIYTCGAMGDLKCLKVEDGSEVWSLHLQNDLAGRLPDWGYAASPVIHEEKLIIQPGADQSEPATQETSSGAIVALNRFTGKPIWSSLSDEAGYCTPIVRHHAGIDLLVFWTPSHIRGLNAETGESLWEYPYEITYKVSIATPILHQDIVLVCGYWDGSKAIQLGTKPEEAELLWEDRRNLRGLMSQPLYKGDCAYLLDKQYGLTCFELKTGDKKWDDENQTTPRGRNPQATLVWLNDSDRAMILNAEGEFLIARLTPESFTEESRVKLLDNTWAHPAYAGEYIIARSDTQIVCYRLPIK